MFFGPTRDWLLTPTPHTTTQQNTTHRHQHQHQQGEKLVTEFAWAAPDARALRILRQFQPLVEIGSGLNAYWGRCLHESGVDIDCFDILEKKKKNKGTKRASREGDIFEVKKGGPDVLLRDAYKDGKRNLFLCFPDEDVQEGQGQVDDGSDDEHAPASLALACLNNFSGDYVVHVGELFGDTVSCEQAPFGRSSGAEFQCSLYKNFHCLLKASLPKWPHEAQTISVWKRSETCAIHFLDDDEDEDDAIEDVSSFRYIPKDERLPADVAAPCLKHLLEENEITKSGG